MAILTHDESVIQLSSNVQGYRYHWTTGFMPAVGMTSVTNVLKSMSGGGTQALKTRLAIQTAEVRTNDPDDPTTLGTERSGDGEWNSSEIDLTTPLEDKLYFRLGVAYKAAAVGDAWATVSSQVAIQCSGKLLGSASKRLVAPDTSTYYEAITDWIPALMAAKVIGALSVKGDADFRAGLAYQVADTSVGSPDSWADCSDTAAGTEEWNTGELTITYSATPEYWVRFGVRYTCNSGTNCQGDVAVTIGVVE